MITNKIIDSFLRCDYKSYLQFNNINGSKTEYEFLEEELLRRYRKKFHQKLREDSNNYILSPNQFSDEIKISKNAIIISPIWQIETFNIGFDALELLGNNSSLEKRSYLPISIFSQEKVSKLDKLSLVIKCLILEKIGIKAEFCKIIYGYNLKSTKVKISSYIKEAKRKLNELIKIINNPETPRFYKNKHCKICEFQGDCQTKLIEADDLSLLGGISQKEVLKKNNRGIFSIYQLSYTFRPRKKKRKKRQDSKNKRFLWELKALALREKKTYIQEIPQLIDSHTQIYLDLEGLPEEEFVYLIGLIIKNDKTEKSLSFWANCKEEEETIFQKLFDTLLKIQEYTIYHYGNYEIRTLKRISKNLDHSYQAEVNRIIKNSTNLLSIFTSIVYPPTYTNELKDIGGFLGFKWSDQNASGIQSIVWRKKWELSGDTSYQHRLIEYNLDDCNALKIIRYWLMGIEREITNENYENFLQSENANIEEGYSLQYGRKNFVFPELENVSKYAYFDYQQNKIYLKSNKRIKQAIKRKANRSKLLNKIDKVIEISPERCPVCYGTTFEKLTTTTRTTVDLHFMKNGIKKWVIKWIGGSFKCLKCRHRFSPRNLSKLSFWGNNLVLWSVNHYIQYRLSYNQIVNILSDSFNIQTTIPTIGRFKEKLAKKYKKTYEEIYSIITKGNLIHADETQIDLRNLTSCYVWVFANMDSVFYLLKPNREADFLHDFLSDFQGVLVSDFYSGYDSMKCRQQKCLVHLIRDLNEDLLKNQFNQELKNLIFYFGKLLQKIMDSVNHYGLKQRFLKKHQKDVDNFYIKFISTDYETDLVIKYQKRFQKYRDKLFTFLHHDNVPWNNNNAESAIKPLAKYRRASSGMATTNGIEDYLILLSIQQTCRYRGISFWEFLKSGQKSIEEYSRKH